MTAHTEEPTHVERDRPRVVFVDDEDALCHIAGRVLSRWGYLVWTAQEPDEALRLVSQWRPHVLVLDLHVGAHDGREILQRVRAELGEAAPRHFFCSGGPVDAEPTLCKPFELPALIEAVRAAMGSALERRAA